LQDALHSIAKFLKTNVIISPDVKGNVSLHLSHVLPEEMLTILLTSHDLIRWNLGDTWVIDTRTAFIQKQQNELKIQDLMEQSDALQLHVFKMHYAKAEDISHFLEDNNHSLLSKRGHVRVDLRTNSLCIQDTEKHLNELDRLVRQIDIPVQQVLIKTRLASVDTDFEQELGLFFDLQSHSDQGQVPLGESPLPRYSLAIAKLADGSLLDVRLSALENQGHGELISSPSLFTANQQTASIESGEEIPYQEVSRSGATSVAFKKAVLSLKVTPQIMPNHSILLHLQINQDKPSNRVILGVPAINTRQINTNVLVRNGQTIVLGGIYETSQEEGYTRVPFLSKIPVLGLIFQQKKHSEDKRELLIFVTPKIIS